MKIVTSSLLVSITSSTLSSTSFSAFRRLASVEFESFEFGLECAGFLFVFALAFVLAFVLAFDVVLSASTFDGSDRVDFRFRFLVFAATLALCKTDAKRSSHASSHNLNWASVPLHLWNCFEFFKFCHKQQALHRSLLNTHQGPSYLSNRIHADAMTFMLSISSVVRAFRKTLKWYKGNIWKRNPLRSLCPNLLSSSVRSLLHFQVSEFDPQCRFCWIIRTLHNGRPQLLPFGQITQRPIFQSTPKLQNFTFTVSKHAKLSTEQVPSHRKCGPYDFTFFFARERSISSQVCQIFQPNWDVLFGTRKSSRQCMLQYTFHLISVQFHAFGNTHFLNVHWRRPGAITDGAIYEVPLSLTEQLRSFDTVCLWRLMSVTTLDVLDVAQPARDYGREKRMFVSCCRILTMFCRRGKLDSPFKQHSVTIRSYSTWTIRSFKNCRPHSMYSK